MRSLFREERTHITNSRPSLDIWGWDQSPNLNTTAAEAAAWYVLLLRCDCMMNRPDFGFSPLDLAK